MKKTSVLSAVVVAATGLLPLACTPSKESAKEFACPIEQQGEQWRFVAELSDEFNANEIDTTKWSTITPSWGPWSWREEHVGVEQGILSVATNYDPHERGGKELYYTSGILTSHAPFVYGYTEARVKGCELKMGVCPAYWLRSIADPKVDSIVYCEIDIIELQQSANSSIIDCNLHTRVRRGDEVVWVRPQQRPDLCQNAWEAPWNPREEYHIYGCENRPDSITFYIDGEVVAQQPNVYWHHPMKITFSMGLRPPLIEYANGDRLPVAEASTPVEFPTSMKVDWVRSWVKE